MHASALVGSGEVTGCGYTIPLQGEEWDQAPRFPEATVRSATAGSQGVQTPLDQVMPGDPQPRVHQAAGGPLLCNGLANTCHLQVSSLCQSNGYEMISRCFNLFT